MKKAVSGIVLMLLLTSMLSSAFIIQQVKATGTIFISADGSINPPTAPIQRDGDVYTFTDNIIGYSILVSADNIIIDGAGYALEGPLGGLATGIDISGVNVTIKNMEIKSFEFGIWLYTSNNKIYGNNITANGLFEGVGIYLESSFNIIDRNNITVSNNFWFDIGICLGGSNNVITDNILTGSGLVVGNSYQNIVENNIVNGKPLIYLEEASDYSIGYAGQVVLVNCNNIRVGDLDLSNISVGVQLWETYNSLIYGNSVTANDLGGIWLSKSSYNSIYRNNVTVNGPLGIGLFGGVALIESSNNIIYENRIVNNPRGIFSSGSSNNVIYHNSFVNNYYQVSTSEFMNVWDDGYPSGGNYWSDYTGVDANTDGIGDTPYIIDDYNRDRYPLMKPWTAIPASDIYWLAKAIMSEASVGTQKEQIAVGWTVLNRLDSGRFGDSIEDVVKGGYAYNQEPTEEIRALAKDLLERKVQDPTEGAMFFFSPRSMPKEGDDTTGFDVGGGLHQVPYDGQNKKVWFPSWAKPEKGTEITEYTIRYLTAEKMPRKLEWRNLTGIRNWYFMFYRPFTKQIQTRGESPMELRVIDSEGRVTGLVNGTVVIEIPESDYFENTVTIFFPNDTYRYLVAGTTQGLYGLTVTAVTTQENITFSALDIPTSAEAIHQYTVDWDALSLGEEGVTVMVDADGDGVFEHIFTSDNELAHLPGDINSDGKVDIKDIAQAGLAFGSYIGHPRWNPIADENEDGKIDIKDLALIAKNFGKTYL